MTDIEHTLEVLFDTTSRAYRGFPTVRHLERFPLGYADRLSELLAANTTLAAEIARIAEPLHIALFGWIDSAAFEIDRHIFGDREEIESVFQRLDVYRPGEGGDLGLAIGEGDWHKAVLIEVSFEPGAVSLSRVERDA